MLECQTCRRKDVVAMEFLFRIVCSNLIYQMNTTAEHIHTYIYTTHADKQTSTHKFIPFDLYGKKVVNFESAAHIQLHFIGMFSRFKYEHDHAILKGKTKSEKNGIFPNFLWNFSFCYRRSLPLVSFSYSNNHIAKKK